MLKSAVSSYKDNTLEDAIKKYAEAIEQASEAENKIETVKDYTEAKNATEEKRKKRRPFKNSYGCSSCY